jgi:hypothetical protein
MFDILKNLWLVNIPEIVNFRLQATENIGFHKKYGVGRGVAITQVFCLTTKKYR